MVRKSTSGILGSLLFKVVAKVLQGSHVVPSWGQIPQSPVVLVYS